MIPGLPLALLALLEAHARAGEEETTAVLLGLAATLPLLVRNLPFAAAVVTAANVTLFLSPTVAESFAGLVAQGWVCYLVAERYRGRVAIGFGAVLVGVLALAPDPGWSSVALLALGLGGLGLGNSRRLRVEVSAARDDQAVLEERARIAREMHDVVAHHVSAIAIQADTGRLTTGDVQFEAIGDTAREAMTEMRRVLGVLRTDDASLAPQPGLDQIPELLDTARASGTDVRLTVEGEERELSPGVGLTAYRVLQEALTNARRHAPGASVEVALRYLAETLVLRVADNGPGSHAEPGLGLTGMRERVTMVGGELSIDATHGFVVEATLPT